MKRAILLIVAGLAFFVLCSESHACTTCNLELREAIVEQFWDMTWRVLLPFPFAAAIFLAIDRMD